MSEEGQSIFDKAKDKIGDVKDKIGDMVGGQEDKIDSAVDKTGDFIDDKTGGKFSEKIDSAQDAVKGAVDKITPDDEESPAADAVDAASEDGTNPML